MLPRNGPIREGTSLYTKDLQSLPTLRWLLIVKSSTDVLESLLNLSLEWPSFLPSCGLTLNLLYASRVPLYSKRKVVLGMFSVPALGNVSSKQFLTLSQKKNLPIFTHHLAPYFSSGMIWSDSHILILWKNKVSDCFNMSWKEASVAQAKLHLIPSSSSSFKEAQPACIFD